MFLAHAYQSNTYIAGSTTASSVNADDSISNDAKDSVAVSVAHDWDVPHLPQDFGDATGAV